MFEIKYVSDYSHQNVYTNILLSVTKLSQLDVFLFTASDKFDVHLLYIFHRLIKYIFRFLEILLTTSINACTN